MKSTYVIVYLVGTLFCLDSRELKLLFEDHFIVEINLYPIVLVLIKEHACMSKLSIMVNFSIIMQ